MVEQALVVLSVIARSFVVEQALVVLSVIAGNVSDEAISVVSYMRLPRLRLVMTGKETTCH